MRRYDSGGYDKTREASPLVRFLVTQCGVIALQIDAGGKHQILMVTEYQPTADESPCLSGSGAVCLHRRRCLLANNR